MVVVMVGPPAFGEQGLAGRFASSVRAWSDRFLEAAGQTGDLVERAVGRLDGGTHPGRGFVGRVGETLNASVQEGVGASCRRSDGTHLVNTLWSCGADRASQLGRRVLYGCLYLIARWGQRLGAHNGVDDAVDDTRSDARSSFKRVECPGHDRHPRPRAGRPNSRGRRTERRAQRQRQSSAGYSSDKTDAKA
jgi:hypothetical protein